tara:strand:- start:95 stop:472 length:378 start_codon:yes stop_codon:yes gene_type:complete
MKITKNLLKEIIKEEIKETKAFALSSKKYPVRSLAKRPADPDSDEDDAAELEAGLDLSGFQLTKMKNGMYQIIDAETGESVIGPFRTEAQGQERMQDPNLAADYEAAKNILGTRAGDYSSYTEKN